MFNVILKIRKLVNKWRPAFYLLIEISIIKYVFIVMFKVDVFYLTQIKERRALRKQLEILSNRTSFANKVQGFKILYSSLDSNRIYLLFKVSDSHAATFRTIFSMTHPGFLSTLFAKTNFKKYMYLPPKLACYAIGYSFAFLAIPCWL